MLLERDVQVLVCGAGPVGLMAALSLARRGVRAAVVDEQPRTAARTYACALHPRSSELLDDVGAARTELIKLVYSGRYSASVARIEPGRVAAAVLERVMR